MLRGVQTEWSAVPVLAQRKCQALGRQVLLFVLLLLVHVHVQLLLLHSGQGECLRGGGEAGAGWTRCRSVCLSVYGYVLTSSSQALHA